MRILWENFRFRTPERVGQCDVEVLLEVDEVIIRIRGLEDLEDAPHVAHYVHRDILQQFGLEKKRQTWVYEGSTNTPGGLTSGSGV